MNVDCDLQYHDYSGYTKERFVNLLETVVSHLVIYGFLLESVSLHQNPKIEMNDERNWIIMMRGTGL